MRLAAFLPSFFRTETFDCVQDVMDDARELIRIHGERAHDVAQLKAFQQDAGLTLAVSPDGHWNRVAREIAQQRGTPVGERRADFKAAGRHA